MIATTQTFLRSGNRRWLVKGVSEGAGFDGQVTVAGAAGRETKQAVYCERLCMVTCRAGSE